MVTEGGGAWGSWPFLLSFHAIPLWLQDLHVHLAEQELYRPSEPPFLESSLATLCCNNLSMSLGWGKGVSPFPTSKNNQIYLHFTYSLHSLWEKFRKLNISFSSDILKPQIDWSLEKLWAVFLCNFANQVGAPSTSITSFLFLTLLIPHLSLIYMHSQIIL